MTREPVTVMVPISSLVAFWSPLGLSGLGPAACAGAELPANKPVKPNAATDARNNAREVIKSPFPKWGKTRRRP